MSNFLRERAGLVKRLEGASGMDLNFFISGGIALKFFWSKKDWLNFLRHSAGLVKCPERADDGWTNFLRKQEGLV